MACGPVQRSTPFFWGPKGLGATGPEAYDAAKARLAQQAARWTAERRKEAACDPECQGPFHFRTWIEEVRVYGQPERGHELYAIWIGARLHVSWDCLPPHVAAPAPIPDSGSTGSTSSSGSSSSTQEPPPDNLPCVVKIKKTKEVSSRNGTGLYDWELDLEFTATATNSSHGFSPGGCIIKSITLHEPGSWLSGSTNLAAGFGLTIVNGADVASVSGLLTRPPLPLNGYTPVEIRVEVYAIDDKGHDCTETFRFKPQ